MRQARYAVSQGGAFFYKVSYWLLVIGKTKTFSLQVTLHISNIVKVRKNN